MSTLNDWNLPVEVISTCLDKSKQARKAQDSPTFLAIRSFYENLTKQEMPVQMNALCYKDQLKELAKQLGKEDVSTKVKVSRRQVVQLEGLIEW